MGNTVNQTELFKTAFRELMKSVGTNVPGHILSFDKDTQMAQVQIGIEQADVNGKFFKPAPLIEVYVYMPGGDFIVECQIDVGTEGLIIFSQRCIDGWTDTGGIAKNPIMRFHDMSDAFFLPGVKSQPNKVTTFENNGIRLRNKDGSNFIWLKNDGTAEITVTTLNVNGNIVHEGDTIQTGNVELTGDQETTGAVTITGDTIQTGNINVTGDVSATGTITGTTDVVGAGKSVGTHTHVGSATAPDGPVSPTGVPV